MKQMNLLLKDRSFLEEIKQTLINFRMFCLNEFKITQPYHSYQIEEVMCRHLYTASRYIFLNDNIINLSGCGTGSSDIVLGMICNKLGKNFISHDSPNNPFFSASIQFCSRKNNINIKHQTINLEKSFNLSDINDSSILFTEIVEHLDISAIHHFLIAIQNATKKCTMYVTTPNIHYWKNLTKLLLGIEIFGGFEQEKYLIQNYGHIHLFTKKYLSNLFESANFKIKNSGYATWPKTIPQLYKTRNKYRLSGEILEFEISIGK